MVNLRASPIERKCLCSIKEPGDCDIVKNGTKLEDFGSVEVKGRLYHFFPKFDFFCPCHNFFPLSSVQIIIIPACCLLCVF